jgi:glucose/arabinose dehydrogenase
MPRPLWTGFAVLATALALAGPAAAATLPAGFGETTLASFSQDIDDVTWAPDGRMFVADRAGQVFAHNPGDPPGTNQLVLNISDDVSYTSGDDRGLMSITTDHDFTSNHFLYLLYTVGSDDSSPAPSDSHPKLSTLTRVTVNDDNSVVGGTTSPTQTIILGSERNQADADSPNGVCNTVSNTHDCIPSEGTSHSVGTVRSDADGTLWVSTGDGHDFTRLDPLAYNDNDPATFRGKIMHVDRNGNGLPGHPFCPGNALTDVCTKIFAGGIRQPFRFTIRPTGGIAFGEVGEDSYEEINLASGGEDFGWPCWEGTVHTPSWNYPASTECAADYAAGGATAPAFNYPHVSYGMSGPVGCDATAPNGNAAVGGPTYVGDQYPAGYRGTLFMGDYICSWLSRFTTSGNTITGFVNFSSNLRAEDLESAPDGNIVYVDGAGAVREIVYLPGNKRPTVSATGSPSSGVAPVSVNFSASASDPDGDPIHYDWDFGDGSAHANAATPTHTYASGGNWVATVTVDDGRGMSATASVPVSVTGTSTGGSKPQVKVAGVSLAGSVARLAGRGILKGSFTSTQSIRALNVSLWRGRVGAGASASSCRFWSQRFGKLERGSCRQAHWLRVTLHRKGSRYTWTLRLGARLPRGSYTVVVRALPRSAKLAPSAPKRLRLRVTR